MIDKPVTIEVCRIFRLQGRPPLVVLVVTQDGVSRRVGIDLGTWDDMDENAYDINDEEWQRLEKMEKLFTL